jgi:hypothetical protein
MPSAKRDDKPDEWLARVNLMNVAVPRKTEHVDRPTKPDPKTRMRLRDEAEKLSKKKSED